jgi:hypothetical protein
MASLGKAQGMIESQHNNKISGKIAVVAPLSSADADDCFQKGLCAGAEEIVVLSTI